MYMYMYILTPTWSHNPARLCALEKNLIERQLRKIVKIAALTGRWEGEGAKIFVATACL